MVGPFQRLPIREICLLGRQLQRRREVSLEAFRRTYVCNNHRHGVTTYPYFAVVSRLRLSLVESLGRRSYSRRVDRQQLEVTTENYATGEPVTRGRVKKQTLNTNKSKRGDLALNSTKASGVVAIELDFPFEGTLNKPEASSALSTSNHLQHSSGDTFTIRIGTANTESDARTYNIHKNDEVFHLPSVTTVLSHTLPRQRGFMLSHWKREMVREFGENGYREARDKIRHIGSKFHAELESYLHRPHLISVKPQVDFSSSTPTHHTHLSPLPQPLSFPPNHSNNIPSTTKNTQIPVNSQSNSLLGELEEEEQGQHEEVGEGKGGEDKECSSDENTNQSDVRNTGYLESVQHVLADVSEVYALESVVTHTELGYSGTCDCIATYRDSVCVVDWKTSSKPRPLTSDLYDYPLQAVAYAGAVNQDPHYPFKVENVVIVTAYPSGEPCHAHFLPHSLCQDYWKQWLARLLQYQTLFSSDLGDVCS